MSVAETRLITAAEFLGMPNLGPSELVRGRIVPMSPPGFRHGRIGLRIAYLLQVYLDSNDIGRVVGLDSGVVTRRDPDTVRGADLSYYSYSRLPEDQDPQGYPALPPEIVWEVRSPGDRWKDVLEKVSEYLQAGVLVVCVVDPERQCLVTYYPDRPDETLSGDKIWREPPILPDFELPVEQVFAGSKR